MDRDNYRPLDDLPTHQRDFPPGEPPIQHGGGSWLLALLVGAYLIAIGAGLALLVTLPTDTETTEIAGR
jgi:hypothetical protein